MPTVQILLNGSDVTDKVLFATAYFKAKVNGKAGDGYMRVRDDDSTFSFPLGCDWLVLVDGDAVWRGFAMQCRRVYIAPAMNVGESAPHRFMDVYGPDGNILFTSRVVFDNRTYGDGSKHPENMIGTQFPAATADTVAIGELTSNWLDLSLDHIDVSASHVGDLDPAQKTRAWSGSYTWGEAMDEINWLPNGIYYLRPESGLGSSTHYTMVYGDVETPTSPFGLSDQPDGSSMLGFREMEITYDGTGLVTDEMAWGIGYGKQTPVFKRVTDASAVATHGVWQDGRVKMGVYKQDTVDRIANSVVYGSPSNHRGAKDDKVAIELTTYHPGLLAGHVVPFASAVWGITDNIPVRQSTLTFDAPDGPKWRLTLSHEIDVPWDFMDLYWPKFKLNFKIPPLKMPVLIPSSVSGACDCGLTDTFTRIETSGWGTADCGLDWSTGGTVTPTSSVDGNYGYLVNPGGLPDAMVDAGFGTDTYAYVGSFTRTMVFGLDNALGMPGVTASVVDFSCIDLAGSVTPNIEINPSDGSGWLRFETTLLTGTALPAGFFDNTSTYTWKVYQSGSDTVTAIDKGGTVYTTSIAELPLDVKCVVATHTYQSGTYSYVGFTLRIDSIDIPEINLCSLSRLDNFNRTVASGWGMSDSGETWVMGYDGTGTSVSGGYGLFDSSMQDVYGRIVQPYFLGDPAAGWLTTSFTATTRFKVSAVDTSGYTSFFFGVMADNGYAGVYAQIVNAGGNSVYAYSLGASASVAKSDWAADTWYTAVVSVNYGVGAKAKVWADGDPDPGWMVSCGAGASAPVNGKFGYTLSDNSSSPRLWSIDWADFDYPGRPCYWKAETVVFDDFGRTVNAGSSPWTFGTASSGYAWSSGGVYPIHGAGCDGSEMYVNYGSNIVNTATGHHDATDPWGAGWFRLRAKIRLTTTPVHASLVEGDILFQFGSGIGCYARIRDVGGEFGAGTVFGTQATAKTDWAGGTWYWLEWNVNNGAGSQAVRCYADGAPPTPWSAYSWGYGVLNSNDLLLSVSTGNSVSTGWSLQCDEVQFIVYTAAAGVPPDLTTGLQCEDLTRTSSTVYSTSAAFTANTTIVWRNGTTQIAGVDYNEDGGLHSITFTTTVLSEEEVRACYEPS